MEDDTSVQGLKYKAGTKIYFHDNGRIRYGTLAEDKKIYKYLFRAGAGICQDEKENVTCGTLAALALMSGAHLHPGTYVGLTNEEITSARLITDTKVKGLTLRGGSTVELYKNGNLKVAVLLDDQKIGKINYLGTIGIDHFYYDSRHIRFYENGQVSEGKLAEDTKIDGIKYKANEKITFYKSGKVSEGILAEDAEYRNTKYKAGRPINYDQLGRVTLGTITEDVKMGGNEYAAGTTILYGKNYRLSSLLISGEARIGKARYVAGCKEEERNKQNREYCRIGWFPNPCCSDYDLGFHENGRISSGYLMENVTINGITYQGGSTIETPETAALNKFCEKYKGKYHYDRAKGRLIITGNITAAEKSELLPLFKKEDDKKSIEHLFAISSGTLIQYHENGKVASGTLFQDTVIQGVKYVADSLIEYHKNGKVQSGTLAKDQTIQGKRFLADTELHFHPNGRLEYVVIPKDKVIFGASFKEGSRVYFKQRGTIDYVDAAYEDASKEIIVIKGKKYMINERIHYFDNGALAAATLFDDAIFNNIKYKAGSWIGFYDDGKVAQGRLAQDVAVGNRTYRAGTEVNLNYQGKITGEVKDK